MMKDRALFYAQSLLGSIGIIAILLIPPALASTYNMLYISFTLLTLAACVFCATAYLVWRAHQQARRDAIAQIQVMLKDVATNQITLIRINMMLSRPTSDRHTQNVLKATETLLQALTALSEQSLADWERKYSPDQLIQTEDFNAVRRSLI